MTDRDPGGSTVSKPARPVGNPFVFCVDGGGTRSRARLFDQSGSVLASATSGPCNPSTDKARALQSLNELWRSCCDTHARDPGEVTGVVLAIGAAGLYVPSACAAFLAECPPFSAPLAMTDGYAALIGAGLGEASALMIVGTGVAGHRLYSDGRSIQRDAWGWVAGDRGSGAWLGRAGLRHAVAALDGVVPRDDLARAIIAAIGGARALADGWLRGLTPDRLGALAPVVLDAAARGEDAARVIRDRAVSHLARLAGVLDATAVPLYAAGGVADVLRPFLEDAIQRPVLRPEADALTGCWLVATGRAPPERADFFGLDENA